MAGPVHLILGGTGGIGSALSRRLRAAGTRVVVAGRGADKVAAPAAELGSEGLMLDATRFAEVETGVKQAVERLGRVDGIACCIGSLLLKPAHLTGEEELQQTLDQNVKSAFAAVGAAVAATVAWLLDPAQGWVSGQVLGVDGDLATLRGR